jgi:carbon monoxide dehydrogenase subunit G
VLIENEFVVAAPADRVWAHLLDVERVAPCMPGAQLTEVVDDHTWKGKTSIKVGPVSLAFAGTVVMEERDDVGHRVVLNAKGMEQRGKGAASARVESHLEEAEGGTKVVMRTDLTISGPVAQYGRGMISDISQRLTQEFADCLQANMGAQSGAEPSPSPAAPAAEPATSAGEARGTEPNPPAARVATPVKGIRVTLWALWRALIRWFRRLFGSPS